MRLPTERHLMTEKYKGITIRFKRTYDYVPNLCYYVVAAWRYSLYGPLQEAEAKTKHDAFKKARKEIKNHNE